MEIEDNWKKFLKHTANPTEADIKAAKEIAAEIVKRETIRARAAKKDLN